MPLRFLSKLIVFPKRNTILSPLKLDGDIFSTKIAIDDSVMCTDYNPELITILIKEHKDIVKVSYSIKNLIDHHEWKKAQDQLKHLSSLIHAHMNAETVTLYHILEQIHLSESEEVEMIKFIRKEMAAVGFDLIGFINKYSEIPVENINKNAFINEYDKLLYTMSARIELEESTLYPLYEILLSQKY
ncbi:MAG: hemerythrin domain-containing protein [Wohlfahrtiimonas sp.]